MGNNCQAAGRSRHRVYEGNWAHIKQKLESYQYHKTSAEENVSKKITII